MTKRGRARLRIWTRYKNAANFKGDLNAHAAQHFTAEELRIIRKREALTEELIGKLLDGTMHFAWRFFETHPRWHNLPRSEEAPYTG
jgi:hypothetical protein